jgi:hypothetical protein
MLRFSALFTRTGEGEGYEGERGHIILKSADVYNKIKEETNVIKCWQHTQQKGREQKFGVQDNILPFDKYVHMQSTCLASEPWVKMDAFQFRENPAERITVWHNPVLTVPWLSC